MRGANNNKNKHLQSNTTEINEIESAKTNAYGKQLLIGTLNVCGLKRRSLYPEFVDLINKYDIFVP